MLGASCHTGSWLEYELVKVEAEKIRLKYLLRKRLEKGINVEEDCQGLYLRWKKGKPSNLHALYFCQSPFSARLHKSERHCVPGVFHRLRGCWESMLAEEPREAGALRDDGGK